MTDQDKLAKKRLDICKKCPLLTNDFFGYICDRKKYMNLATKEISFMFKEGWRHGCGCLLDKKVLNPAESCPLKKW